MAEEEWYATETQKLEILRAATVREIEDAWALARASNPEIWEQMCSLSPWEALEEAGLLPDFVDPEEAPRGATKWLQSREGQEHLKEAWITLFWEAQR